MPPKPTQPAKADDFSNLQKRGEKWYVRYKLGGKSRCVSLDTTDVRQARQKRDNILREIDDRRAGVAPPTIHSWQDAVDRTLRWMQLQAQADELAASAVDRYETSIVQITKALGWQLDERGEPLPIPMESVTPKSLDDFVMARREEGRATSTLLNDVTAWGHVMRRAKIAEMIKVNWMLAVDRKEIIGARRTVLAPPKDAQVEALAVEVSEWSDDMAMLIRWLRETGMRLAEALNLRAEDIHPCGQRATLRHGVKRNRHDGGAMTRTIHLGRAARFLADMPKKGRLFAGLNSDSAVTSTRYGQWCRQRQAREAAVAKEQGRKETVIVRHRLHDLRHAFACASLADDPKCIYLLSVHLGHTKVDTTEIYTHYFRRNGAQWSYDRDEKLFGSLPTEPALRPRAALVAA